jgi:tRNA modification GTPase
MAGINLGEDTIAAMGTPFGEAAVGIVRLSGPQAVKITEEIFLSKNGKPLSSLKTYSLRYGWIVRNKEANEIVDEVVVSLMRAPKSYTREDVVEINSHGGAKILSSILELVLEKGARVAQPGEFTKRAFLNGRLDLAQAEAVLDIIQAKSDLALKNSLSQLSGDVSRCICGLRDSLLEVLADMEAAIDFSDDQTGQNSTAEFLNRLSDISRRLNNLLKNSFQGKIIREGLKVVIFGRPNTGKSSLLNAILKQERAIVTPIAGTTRDTIEEFVNIKGLAVRLIDTAGILEYRDAIEKEALERTRRMLEASDLVLFLIDGSSPLTEEDRILAGQIGSKKVLLVINKNDQPQRIDPREFEKLFSRSALRVSALKGENIAALEDLIWQSVFEGAPVFEEGGMISNVRHIEILKRTALSLETATDSLKQELSLEFAALDLKKALETLGEVTGEVLSDELLDAIFSKFCIGK